VYARILTIFSAALDNTLGYTTEAAMLSTTDKMLFLKRVSWFSGMTLEQIWVLIARLEVQHFLSGEVIMYEGDFSQELYIPCTIERARVG